MTKPFLKWAGGKAKLVPHISQQLPHAHRLIEPFAGSAAVSLALEFDAYLLNDINPDLIGVYQTLKQEKQGFIDYVQSFFTPENNQETRYYDLREQFNHSENLTERAALFIYLNRHAFNGLCRYNSKGGFNVPFGRYKLPYFPAAEMRGFVQKSARMELRCDDFQAAFRAISPDDVIYCDPPYVPLTETSSFTAYAQGGFTWRNQVELAQLIEQSTQQCRSIVLSNHDTPQTRELYHNAHLATLTVQRNIAAKSSSRVKVGELLARWHNKPSKETK